MLDALLATGASRWEAAGLVANAAGTAAVAPLWDRWVKRLTNPAGVVKALDEVACGSPATASIWLNRWLTGRSVNGNLDLGNRRWVTVIPGWFGVSGFLDLRGTSLVSLPPFVAVGGNLNLEGTGIASLPTETHVQGSLQLGSLGIEALPEGLRVGGGLDLHDTPIRSLPAKLHLRGKLTLVGAAAWDGQIPDDAHVGFLVVTDRHPRGMPLSDWRDLYPDGERA
jgi:hypothetical protein